MQMMPSVSTVRVKFNDTSCSTYDANQVEQSKRACQEGMIIAQAQEQFKDLDGDGAPILPQE